VRSANDLVTTRSHDSGVLDGPLRHLRAPDPTLLDMLPRKTVAAAVATTLCVGTRAAAGAHVITFEYTKKRAPPS
jgi:hypothetical protein